MVLCGAIANSQSIRRRRHIAILRSSFEKSRSNRVSDSEFLKESKAKFFPPACAKKPMERQGLRSGGKTIQSNHLLELNFFKSSS
jgi:hypothetical protein